MATHTAADHFIEASRGRLRKLQARPLDQHVFCAMMIDGTCFHDQQVVAAIGLTLPHLRRAITSLAAPARIGALGIGSAFRSRERGHFPLHDLFCHLNEGGDRQIHQPTLH